MKRTDSLQFSVSEEEVPPEPQHCEQEWSPSLGQEDPAPTKIQVEHEELKTSQEEEQLQGLLDTKYSILTPPCVKSLCDQENPLWSLSPTQTQTEENRESDSKPVDSTPFLVTTPLMGIYFPGVPSVNQNNSTCHISTVKQVPTTSQQMISVEKKFSCGDCGKYIRLKKKVVANKHIHKDSLQFSVSEEEVPPEQQHWEQELSPSLGQEDPEPTQVKEEQGELRTSQEEEQFQGLLDTKDSILTPPCVESECDQENSVWSSTPPQSQTEENRESDSKQVDSTPFLVTTPLMDIYIPSIPSVNQNIASCHISTVKQVPTTSKQMITVEKTFSCGDCGKYIRLKKKVVTDKHNHKDSLQFSVSKEEVPPEQQHCEQEWSPSLGQEDPEPTQIKEEQEELRTSQEEEQRQGPLYTKDSILTPPCVKNERDQENAIWNLTLETFSMKTRLMGTDIPLVPSDNKTNSTSHISTVKQLPTTNKLTYTGENKFSFVDNDFKITKSVIIHNHIPTEEKRFNCDICGKTLSCKNSLILHKRIHTGEKPYSCSDCQKTFSRKDSLIIHKYSHTEKKPFSCGDCGKSFSLKKILNHHKLTHTAGKKFNCGDCGKIFKHMCNLNTHKRIHTEKPFSCCDCGKTFHSKNSFIIHRYIHTGNGPFRCSDCGKNFSRKESLISHKHIHTGEKPFSCDVCGKKFSRKQGVIVHKRIHTGEKPYSCSDCQKTFIHKHNLITHKYLHTGEKTFRCEDCGKSFSQKRYLMRHELIHTGEKPHGCSLCSKTFAQEGYLLNHVKNVHTI